jgi:hypothetical protein
VLARLLLVGLLASCDHVLGLSEVHSPDASPYYMTVVLADTPVGYFQLGETTGSVAFDAVDNAPTGSIVGDIGLGQPGPIAGEAITAMEFNGKDGAIEVGQAFAFADTSPFSLECWVKPAAFEAAETFHELVTRWGISPTDAGYHLYYEALAGEATLSFARADGTDPEDIVNTNQFVASSYSHVVATYDGTLMQLYVNGRLQSVTMARFGVSSLSTEFMIGAENDDPQLGTMNGVVGEVAIYDKALSPERVIAHYMAGITPP